MTVGLGLIFMCCISSLTSPVCFFCNFHFYRVSVITHDIDIAILSVTFQYSIEMTQHIVIVSSTHDSPFILVLRLSNSFAKFRLGHPLLGR